MPRSIEGLFTPSTCSQDQCLRTLGLFSMSQTRVAGAALDQRPVDEDRAFLKPLDVLTNQRALPAAVLYDARYPGGPSDGAAGLSRQRAREPQLLAAGRAITMCRRQNTSVPLPQRVDKSP